MQYIETRLINKVTELNNSKYKLEYDDGEIKIIEQDYYNKYLLPFNESIIKTIDDFITDVKIEETPYDTTMIAHFRNGCVFMVNESDDSIDFYYTPKEIKDKGSFAQARRDCCMEQIREKAITYIDNLYASVTLGSNYNTK